MAVRRTVIILGLAVLVLVVIPILLFVVGGTGSDVSGGPLPTP